MQKPNIKEMTVREKIAQSLLVRQSDIVLRADLDYKLARDSHEAAELMEKYQFGGLWAHGNLDVNGMKDSLDTGFDFTTDSYREWLKTVLSKAKIPVICANDNSGPSSFKDLSDITSGLIIGAANDEKLTYDMAYNLAREHALAGYNWIWSPMVDLVSPFMSDIVRPFAGDADMLIKHGIAFSKGMQDANVAACAKHFPGADPLEYRDDHVTPSMLNMSFEDWKKGQGRIFQAMIDAGVYSFMTSAVSFPAVDNRKKNGRFYPSSFSKTVITDLLKGKMHFDGVVITDDVNMGGYTSFFDPEDKYIELYNAGHDVLLGVGIDALDILENAYNDGRITIERIDDACRRVLDLKEKLGLFETADRFNFNYTLEEAKAATAATNKQIAQKGITLLYDKINLIPVSRDKIKKVTIITYTHRSYILKSLETMKKAFEQRGAEVDLRDKLESFNEIKEISQNSDLIVYAGFIGHHAPKGAPSFYDDVFWSLRYAFVEGVEKSVGVSLGYPFIHYDAMADAHVFFNLYRTSPEVQEAFVAALYGEITPQGVSPLDLSVKCRKVLGE